MITEELIQGSYIRNILLRDVTTVTDRTIDALNGNFSGEHSATLASQLSTYPFQISGSGINQTVKFSLLTFLRVLDIKLSKKVIDKPGIYLYNKVVYSILYRNTLGDLRYGLTEDIKRGITEQLKSMNPQNIL